MESGEKLQKNKTSIHSIIKDGQNVKIDIGSGTYQFSYLVKTN